jgi:hypothetical protein
MEPSAMYRSKNEQKRFVLLYLLIVVSQLGSDVIAHAEAGNYHLYWFFGDLI